MKIFTLLLFTLCLHAHEYTRIICIDSSITETVFLLGHGQSVIATDQTSTWPAAAAERPKVGYIRMLGAEGILAQQPDLLLTTDKIRPQHILKQLRQAGLRIEVFSGGSDLASLRARINGIGAVLGATEQATALCEKIETSIHTVSERCAALSGNNTKMPTVLFILHMMNGELTCAGTDTAADWMITHAGGINGMTVSGFKPLSNESLLALQPDIIFCMNKGPSGPITTATLKKHPILATSPAMKNGAVHCVDGMYMLGFGPRLGDALHDFQNLIHPLPVHDK